MFLELLPNYNYIYSAFSLSKKLISISEGNNANPCCN